MINCWARNRLHCKGTARRAPTVPFSLRIDPEIKAQLTQEAERADRTPSYLANQAIKDFLRAKTAKRKAIEKAVEEADKGAFGSTPGR
uniref:CopG family ribbon-helix-helix protein n=1 Tax=Candidatus Electrothrix sp. TaxID=2170559 RepID=UPI0040570E5A